MKNPLPGQSQDLPTNEFLAPYFSYLLSPDDGGTIVRTRRYTGDELFGMDYVCGLPVKTSAVAIDGKIFFCSRLYDMNHRVDQGHIMRTANMELEARL